MNVLKYYRMEINIRFLSVIVNYNTVNLFQYTPSIFVSIKCVEILLALFSCETIPIKVEYILVCKPQTFKKYSKSKIYWLD